MITEIGIVAGEILELLETKNRPLSIAEITFHLDEPVEMVTMSVGWLVRDQYVRIVRSKNGEYQLYLVQEEHSLPERLECNLFN